ncbi:hypothetical protein HX900_26115 [Rhizobium sp. WYCCWR 11290]|uniref:Uncharacterized protein n=1 Tax=Rhizobium changzhiense TaxID=2692317 RepID=A0A7Z0ZUF4_9HYPH|nr:hypothetical protein [Rhizobium changzhiense]NZD64552.1 hypothetical protein [Rhizobium changzhiense]
MRQLEESFEAYITKQPIQCVTRLLEVDPSYIAWKLIVTEAAPPEWPAIIGDIIHNLRASLDLLACELVEMNGHRDISDVYFPFAGSEDQLDHMISKRNFDKAAPQAIALVKELKPFRGGNVAIRAVHDLDIWDKHRAIIPDAAIISAMSGGFGVYELSQLPLGEIGGGVSQRSNLLVSGIEPGVTFSAIVTLTLPKGAPLGELPLIPTLRDLTADFELIIDAFEALH